jgi:hypothetical protein
LKGHPFRGRALIVDPHLLGEDRVETIMGRHYFKSNPMSGLVMWIEAIDDLFTKYIAAMVVRIYGFLGTHRIIGGQMRVVEEVLDGDLFAWGVLMHTQMVSQLNWCRRANSGDFSFRLVLVA